MRVLVTGGHGYFGSMLALRLLAKGYVVRTLDIVPSRINLDKNEMKDIEMTIGDIRDTATIKRSLENVDAVIHAAAIVGEAPCSKNPTLARDINELATYQLVDAAKALGVKKFILISTCSVYGYSEGVVDESSRVVPTSIYQETKINAERYTINAGESNFRSLILRMATLFGESPCPKTDTLLHTFINEAVTKGEITVYDVYAWRPFIHVADAADATILLLESNMESGEIINVGGDELNIQKIEVARKIAKHFPGTTIKEVDIPDSRSYRVSFRKIRQTIGFTPRLTLDDGILEIKKNIYNASL
ncbi:NAD(P)-dependent oxidoreductase [Candidatus Bathyarchaeota archaeon]|nr:NAD(P)-dependent oxidoreductase [Candidatus Bathyarchaeota archaeon]